MDPADSPWITRVPGYSGTDRPKNELREGGCHPLRPNFPDRHARSFSLNHMDRPTTPFGPKPQWFGLFPLRSPLLGESFLFSFPAGTKMFQFPALASVKDGCHPFRMTGYPIRTPAGQRPFAPNRRFSQLITSFFASGSLGIHHAPLFVFLCSCQIYHQKRAILKGRAFRFRLYIMSKIYRHLYLIT